MNIQATAVAGSGQLCPSAQPDMQDPIVLGVLGGDAAHPEVFYLNERLPADAAILARAGPAPTRVLRLAARCEESKCSHFDGADCRLATRVAKLLDPAVGKLPACSIRRDCRWFAQEGGEVCFRCPQVATESAMTDARFRAVALGVPELLAD